MNAYDKKDIQHMEQYIEFFSEKIAQGKAGIKDGTIPAWSIARTKAEIADYTRYIEMYQRKIAAIERGYM